MPASEMPIMKVVLTALYTELRCEARAHPYEGAMLLQHGTAGAVIVSIVSTQLILRSFCIQSNCEGNGIKLSLP